MSSSKPLQQEPQQPAVELLLQQPPAPYGATNREWLRKDKDRDRRRRADTLNTKGLGWKRGRQLRVAIGKVRSGVTIVLGEGSSQQQPQSSPPLSAIQLRNKGN